MSTSQKGGGFGSFVLGLLVGGLMGLLLAPEPGEEARKKLKDRGERALEEIRRLQEEILRRLEEDRGSASSASLEEPSDKNQEREA
ncbi:MAG: YtxH domain-containing protein [Candidatus Hydrothermae bacterium]|nr:YtxH domain-containing protein [Candidatus Hydrothermae bacterium]